MDFVMQTADEEHFLGRKCLIFIKNLLRIITGLDYCWVLNKQQAFIWTNDEPMMIISYLHHKTLMN